MAPPPTFADYPRPIEGPEAKYHATPGHNPVLRGYPLLLAGNL